MKSVLNLFYSTVYKVVGDDDRDILSIEIRIFKENLPVLVSCSTGPKMVSVYKYKNGSELADGTVSVRVGVFKYNDTKIDEILIPVLRSAYDFSVESKFENFCKTIEEAKDEILKLTGEPAFETITVPELSELGCEAVVLGQPELVGMLAQILGGNFGIVLHNVSNSIMFVKNK